jgi:hypothetical protein
MNPDIYSILEDLKKHVPVNPVHPNDVHTHQSFHIARLRVLIAEEEAESAEKMERFTKGLYWFTAALLVLGVIQLFVAFCHP